MAPAELSAQAANLHRSVVSTSTCTWVTVESLRALLLPEPLHGLQTQKPAQKSAKRPTKAALVRPNKAGTAKPKEQGSITICEDPPSQHETIRIEERLALATNVINDTLKALTSAAKMATYSTPNHPQKTSLGRGSSSSSTLDNKAQRFQSPLRHISANQMITPNKRGLKRYSSTNPESENDGLKAQAHCARIGFACLRTLQAQKRKLSLPYLQLESGMSALIHKLIALGFFDMALKELRILRKRILNLIEGKTEVTESSDHDSKIVTKDSTSRLQRETIVDFLRFPKVVDRGPLLSLLTATQLQILRMLANTGVDDFGDLLKHLRLDNPGCPMLLIKQQLDPTQKQSKEKVAHQLETLAQLLLKTCDRTPSGTARKGVNSCAGNIFQVRLLALQTKANWWDLSQHTFDLTKDLTTPLTKFLNVYQRDSEASKEHQYIVAKKALEVVTTLPLININHHEKSFTPLYRILADLAQAAGRSKDAALWVGEAIGSMDNANASQLQKCMIACQMATLQLRADTSYEQDEGKTALLNQAAVCLRGDLHGESVELDELLVVVSSLRKSASAVIIEKKSITEDAGTQSSAALIDECLQVIALSMRFIVRYLGDAPDGAANERSLSRYKHRASLVSSLAPSTVQTITTLGRLYAKSPYEEWKLVDAALQDCTRLATSLENSDSAGGQHHKFQPSLFPQISHTYWCRYRNLRRVSADAGEQKQCLRASIDLIQNREHSVQTAGSLLLKLEHYGMLHESARELKKALQVYEEALQAHFDLGIISTAAEAAMTSSIAIVLDHHEDCRLFARMLLAYIRVASGIKETGATLSLYFDSSDFPICQRLLLLEYQYSAIISKLHSRSNTSAYHASIHEMMKILVTLSSRVEFPVRRLYLVSQMLYLRIAHSAVVEESLLLPILEEYTHEEHQGTPNSNNGLQQYNFHLVSSLALLVTIREDKPNLKAVEETLRSWLDLLRQSPDLNSLQRHVYDMKSWVLQLKVILGYLDAQGLDYLKTLALQVAIKVYESSASYDVTNIASECADLGVRYIRLGYSALARSTLQKAQRYLQSTDGSFASLTDMAWHLASAELSLEIQDYVSCSDHLQFLQENLYERRENHEDRQSFSERMQSQQMAADAGMLRSRLAAAKGRSYEALFSARVSVKSYHQIWSVIERRQSNIIRASNGSPDVGADETLISNLSELSISERPRKEEMSKHAALRSAAFWSLVPRLINGLLQLTCLFAHVGLYPEADYYLKQSRRIAEASHAPRWLSRCLMMEAQHASRKGNESKALQLLEQTYEIIGDASHDGDFALLQSHLAACHTRKGEREAGDVAESKVRNKLRKLKSWHYLDNLLHKRNITEDINTQMGNLSIDKAEPAPPSRPRSRAVLSKGRPKTNATTKVAQSFSEELSILEILPLYQMETTLYRQQAAAALAMGDVALAFKQIDEWDGVPSNHQETVLRAILKAELKLRRVLYDLQKDPVFSVVPESAVSHPSIIQNGQRTDAKVITTAPCNTKQSRKKLPTKATVRQTKQDASVEERDHFQVLQTAQHTITEILRQVQTITATNSLHHAMDVLARISMMLSTLSSLRSRSCNSALFMVYVAELSRMVAMFRESLVIRVEQQILDKVEDRQQPLLIDAEGFSNTVNFDFTDFQALYIDIIPECWDVASISLSNSLEEIIITKMNSNRAPYILRIPFKRQNAMDCDDESFGFQEARKELQDIVDHANRSSQDAGDLSRKGAKTEWWNTRSGLDARLKDFLNNIEDIWLGGFRGIFSPNPTKPEILARFQQSLQNILDRHLPSRQKTGKGKQAGRTVLDPHVLELFVGLGCPSDSNDIDEPLIDLLYFVVDILQFNGERNAYDEIDFDSVVIETLDALRQYHQAVQHEASSGYRQHMILILDKHLHCFPWESLPCMKGRSISRLPSLGCLRKRILQQRQQCLQGSVFLSVEEGLRVGQQNGAFVLNPAGDLTNTQAKFEDPLQELSCWNGIVKREPQEADMKDYLENHDVFLYFGHGSGGQYIRSRTIKKLDKCAVTLLMGCSSGALTEAGDFEPYGTPINYMHAGCPALLATLWDVTDKDIDRFSHMVLEKWGLFNKQQQPTLTSPVKQSARQRTKGKAVDVPKIEEEVVGPVSLNEAVAQARDSCFLKYLNGAAPVVYGIPVFLD